jgi:hypothetical protein
VQKAGGVGFGWKTRVAADYPGEVLRRVKRLEQCDGVPLGFVGHERERCAARQRLEHLEQTRVEPGVVGETPIVNGQEALEGLGVGRVAPRRLQYPADQDPRPISDHARDRLDRQRARSE